MSTPTKLIAAALVILAILLGVLSIFVGRRPAPAALGTAVTPVATFPVVIASQLLPAGQAISADAVRVVQLPVQPTGAYTKVEEVVGHIPRVPIDTGLPLTINGLAQGLTLTLKAGERGVAVPVDEVSGAGNAIQAGDYVDVFFTMKAPEAGTAGAGGGPSDRNIARLLVSRARVLAYGASSLTNGAAPAAQGGTPAPGTNSQAMIDQQRQMARSAVLAVPVEDVDALVLATQAGRLTLALRYPEDSGVVQSALFQAPAPVVRARSDLPATERSRLLDPDNRAYAGIDTLGLGGGLSSPMSAVPLPSAVPTVRTPRAGGRAPGLVEVIRGTDISHEAANGTTGRTSGGTAGQSMPAATDGGAGTTPPPLPAGLMNGSGGAR
ncbi:Flp pilus assembly protein CpaB [Robbsia sp. KACC 23696]|uniref:Flp pilus assembly protein CpaB n=1 Tax=Robbsia sp. KACC 23696 TaxID=3149231 RepID=UPI00325B12E5